jgi:hypothetical protein
MVQFCCARGTAPGCNKSAAPPKHTRWVTARINTFPRPVLLSVTPCAHALPAAFAPPPSPLSIHFCNSNSNSNPFAAAAGAVLHSYVRGRFYRLPGPSATAAMRARWCVASALVALALLSVQSADATPPNYTVVTGMCTHNTDAADNVQCPPGSVVKVDAKGTPASSTPCS